MELCLGRVTGRVHLMMPAWVFPKDVCSFKLVTTQGSSCHLKSPVQSSPFSGAVAVTHRRLADF